MSKSEQARIAQRRKGRKRFNACSGDTMSTYANGGFGVTHEKIKNNPAEILAFVRDTIKALRYSFQNRAEVIKNRPDTWASKTLRWSINSTISI